MHLFAKWLQEMKSKRSCNSLVVLQVQCPAFGVHNVASSILENANADWGFIFQNICAQLYEQQWASACLPHFTPTHFGVCCLPNCYNEAWCNVKEYYFLFNLYRLHNLISNSPTSDNLWSFCLFVNSRLYRLRREFPIAPPITIPPSQLIGYIG